MEKKKILFVCLGNICRSPSAEGVMKAMVDQAGLSEFFTIDSAGILNVHQGEPADTRMMAHARKRGYHLTSISRPIVPADFDEFDVIIGMDDQNMRDLAQKAPHAEGLKKLVKMTDFSTMPGVDRVPDPYYGGPDGFELVLDLLEDACQGLIRHFQS
ncbi:protein-tyrosine phosphatase [Breznakibacter xylanolyticus]|uniref:Protein-tyrosine phosphatase n=1 Tax=Breznakibacter xylanolyticus TaxID=990 RepID=A0A2W7NIV2_9BACT|nr:low molecular weight protein-tyrosine-phosphatase [Breznakibacter xylanolyticus]MBN2744332.1 low molecular weight phosphotyrosine protein phosphatase [Marinilabiliaceae bacterium]PZX20168.1 protein-tyrosine phosphatase [Breznakibacter xylanolyticus]